MNIIVALLLALNVGTFAWSVVGVFRNDGTASPRLTVLKVGALASAVAEVWAVWVSDVPMLRGLGAASMLCFALLSFWWAVSTTRKNPFTLAHSADTPQQLVTWGPYRFVRHPFYTSYLVTYLAGWVASSNDWLWLVVVGMAAIYWDAARIEERKFSASSLATEYGEYASRTGMFFPRVW